MTWYTDILQAEDRLVAPGFVRVRSHSHIDRSLIVGSSWREGVLTAKTDYHCNFASFIRFHRNSCPSVNVFGFNLLLRHWEHLFGF